MLCRLPERLRASTQPYSHSTRGGGQFALHLDLLVCRNGRVTKDDHECGIILPQCGHTSGRGVSRRPATRSWNSVVLAALNAMRGYDDPYCVVGFHPESRGSPGTSRVGLLKQARVWHGERPRAAFLAGSRGAGLPRPRPRPPCGIAPIRFGVFLILGLLTCPESRPLRTTYSTGARHL